MKRILSIFTVAAVMATSCNTNSRTNPSAQAPVVATPNPDSARLAADTAGLAQYQAWKAQNELANMNQFGQNNLAATPEPARTKSSASTAKSTRTTKSTTSSRGSSAGNGSGTMSSESSNTAMAKKKGWSKAAKGAVIGGVAGGVAGAVINKKNRVVGGVVGGVIGAGAGYGIGRAKDKKDGRY